MLLQKPEVKYSRNAKKITEKNLFEIIHFCQNDF